MATIHSDIRIPFSIGDRSFEAVGFLKGGEVSVDGDTMLARTAGENGGAIGEEDWRNIWKRRNQLPQDLWPYYLVTNRRHPGNPRRVSYFSWYSGRWGGGWYWLDARWGARDLVVRCRT